MMIRKKKLLLVLYGLKIVTLVKFALLKRDCYHFGICKMCLPMHTHLRMRYCMCGIQYRNSPAAFVSSPNEDQGRHCFATALRHKSNFAVSRWTDITLLCQRRNIPESVKEEIFATRGYYRDRRVPEMQPQQVVVPQQYLVSNQVPSPMVGVKGTRCLAITQIILGSFTILLGVLTVALLHDAYSNPGYGIWCGAWVSDSVGF